MKVAIIDMGTNTFHLLIAEVEGDHYDILLRERQAVKIGEKGINSGRITPEAWERAIVALKDFHRIIEENNAEKIFATATSAIRNAENGQALVDAIKEETGIETEIISGLQEAQLILKGVKRALQIGKERSLIMDIGGGSIEFIIADDDTTYWLQSFEIGGQRLVEQFHKSDPIATEEIERLNQFFGDQLEELEKACGIYKPKVLIGCSGTFDTLSDIYCEQAGIAREPEATEYPMTIDAFKSIYQDLIEKTRAERLKIPGMIEMRVDMIVVACALVDFLIERLSIKDLRVSAYALKEGVLHNVLDQLKNTVSQN